MHSKFKQSAAITVSAMPLGHLKHCEANTKQATIDIARDNQNQTRSHYLVLLKLSQQFKSAAITVSAMPLGHLKYCEANTKQATIDIAGDNQNQTRSHYLVLLKLSQQFKSAAITVSAMPLGHLKHCEANTKQATIDIARDNQNQTRSHYLVLLKLSQQFKSAAITVSAMPLGHLKYCEANTKQALHIA
ncbi:MAG: hypothetical protein RSB03_03900 [Oscillospiraceae bacterium]